MKSSSIRNFFTLVVLAAISVLWFLPAQASASACELERSQRLDGRSSSEAISYTFHDLDPSKNTELIGNPQNEVCAQSCFLFWCSCIDSSLDFELNSNTITLNSRHAVTFTVKGQAIDCGAEAEPSSGSFNLASIPLDAGIFVPPNILLIMDNSSSMVEGVDGLVASTYKDGSSGYCQPWAGGDCEVGASSPASKSEITRGVGRRLLDTYRDQVNLGLMAYQQNPASSSSSGWNSNLIRAWIVNRLYDVTYNPNNYDDSEGCSFNLTNWDSTDRCNRTANPSDSGGYIYYNIGVPGYSSGSNSPSEVSHCVTTAGSNSTAYQNEPFGFNCYRSKTGISDSSGYSSYSGGTTGSLNDSARARGVTHWGRRMAALSFDEREWTSITSPGLGYLHTPIKALDASQAAAIEKKLNPVSYEFSTGMETDPEKPLINAGLTPLEGTLLTARDYFSGQSHNFGNAQGSNNAESSLPESCGVDAAIWLTDGMPSVSKDGSPYGADTEDALNKAIESAESFHEITGAQLFVVGFAMPPTAEQDALDRLAKAGGSERSFLATDPTGLDDAITSIFDQVIQDSRETATSLAFDSTRLTEDTAVFRAGYRTEDWSGELRALNPNNNDVIWDAEVELRKHRGSVTQFTFDPEEQEGVPLQLDRLPSRLRNSLSFSYNGSFDGRAEDRIRWLNWEAVDGLRSRGTGSRSNLLGSIVHSNPVYLSSGSYNAYDRLEGIEGNQYMSFLMQQRSQVQGSLFVGSNDGRLYAFDAKSGRPLFTYMPSDFLNSAAGQPAPINQLMRLDYRNNHRFFMNGDVTVGQAYIDSSWRELLVGALNQGGRSVFALDVTNPDSFKKEDVLWEFSHEHLGYGVQGASIVRLKNGTWAAVFGNGYDAPSGKTGLFVVDLEQGELIKFIEAQGDSSQPNGLARPAPLLDGISRSASHIYAGDLQGGLWRFDLSFPSSATWSVEKLFQAKEQQPITSQPRVIGYPNRADEYIVLFGTGSFQFIDDAKDQNLQSFYAVFDNMERTNLSRSDLLEQEITGQRDREIDGENYLVRLTSRNEVAVGNKGWYIDLDYSGLLKGERVISMAQLDRDETRVRFNTLAIEDKGLCSPVKRDGFIYELDLESGASLQNTSFIVNLEQNTDLAALFEMVGGISHSQGQTSLSMIAEGQGDRIMSSEDCDGEDCINQVGVYSPDSSRLYWEQIR